MEEEKTKKIENIFKEYSDYVQKSILKGETYSWQPNFIARTLIFDAFSDIATAISNPNADLKLDEALGHVRISAIEVWEPSVYERIKKIKEFKEDIVNTSESLGIKIPGNILVYIDKQEKIIAELVDKVRIKKSGDSKQVKECIKEIQKAYRIADETYKGFINETLPGLRDFNKNMLAKRRRNEKIFNIGFALLCVLLGTILGYIIK